LLTPEVLKKKKQSIKQKKFVVHELEDGYVIAKIGVDFIIRKKNSENFNGTRLERMYNWLKVNHPEFLI
jgi:hypothetical protein